MDLKFLYLTLRGRIGRQTFWIGLIPLLIAYWLATFVTQLMNKSPWWMAGLYAVSLLGVVVATSFGLAMTPVGFTSLGTMLAALWLGILLWLIVELGILKGTQGPNEYGPDPLETAQADPAS